MAPTMAIIVGVLVPLIFLLALLLCLRHLRDPERNTAWPRWVGLCSLAEEQQGSDGNHTLIPLFCMARPCLQGCVLNTRGALEEEHATVRCSGWETQPQVSLLGSVKGASLKQEQTQLDAAT